MKAKRTEKEKTAIVNRYLNGETITNIARDEKLSRGTIYSWIKAKKASFGETKNLSLRDLHYLSQKCKQQEKIINILQASLPYPTATLKDKLALIESMSDKYSEYVLCQAFQVAKGSYYNHILRNKRDKTVYTKKQSEMEPVIEQVFFEYDQIFGAGKIHQILRNRGYAIAESTVRRIMRKNGWLSVRKCAKKFFKQQCERRENLLKRRFTASKPDEVWISDITIFGFNNKKYYICAILDIFSRKVLAYKISLNNSTQLTTSTFKMAYALRKPSAPLIFHDDQGSNYIANRFCRLLNVHNVIHSYSSPGTPYDNAVMESFFGSLKNEELYRQRYRSENEFKKAVKNYITFYNEQRIHTFLSNRTPDSVEKQYFEQLSTKTGINN